MDDVVSLGRGPRRRRGLRWAAAAAALALAAMGILGHRPASAHRPAGPSLTRHAPAGQAWPRGGPVQLAGLGSDAARLLNQSRAGRPGSPTIGG